MSFGRVQMRTLNNQKPRPRQSTKSVTTHGTRWRIGEHVVIPLVLHDPANMGYGCPNCLTPLVTELTNFTRTCAKCHIKWGCNGIDLAFAGVGSKFNQLRAATMYVRARPYLLTPEAMAEFEELDDSKKSQVLEAARRFEVSVQVEPYLRTGK